MGKGILIKPKLKLGRRLKEKTKSILGFFYHEYLNGHADEANGHRFLTNSYNLLCLDFHNNVFVTKIKVINQMCFSGYCSTSELKYKFITNKQKYNLKNFKLFKEPLTDLRIGSLKNSYENDFVILNSNDAELLHIDINDCRYYPEAEVNISELFINLLDGEKVDETPYIVDLYSDVKEEEECEIEVTFNESMFPTKMIKE